MSQKLSKSEERIKRKNEKSLKQQTKNVRLAQNVIITSKPIRIETKPDITKLPRIQVDNIDYKDCALSWDTNLADTEGKWTWGELRQWSTQESCDIIEPHFLALANNTWKEIETLTYNGSGRHRRLLNKHQPLESICNEAQQRWIEDDTRSQFEELFRFRLGTNRRVWGIRFQHHFFMIWYERHHRICPIDNE